MEIQSECYPCIVKMLGTVAGKVLGDGAAAEFVARIEAGEAFQGNPTGRRAPLLVRDAWIELVRQLGDPDPLADLKRRENEAALALLPAARQTVSAAADPLATALALAIIGNSLDVLIPDQAGGDDLMARLVTARLHPEQLAEFRRRLAGAKTIAYLGDNCGEAVFDRLLIETITSWFDVEVTFIARARPALNDVTLAEARAAGLHLVARLIDNGIDDALPSTLLELLGPEARAVIEQADLVVSKGGGNFEMLEGPPAPAGPGGGRVGGGGGPRGGGRARRAGAPPGGPPAGGGGGRPFLVDGKCDPLCRENDVRPGAPILRNE